MRIVGAFLLFAVLCQHAFSQHYINDHFDGDALSSNWIQTSGTPSNYSVSNSKLTILNTIGGESDGTWRAVRLRAHFFATDSMYVSCAYNYGRSPYKQLDVRLINNHVEYITCFRIWDSPSHWILVSKRLADPTCSIELSTSYEPHDLEIFRSRDTMFLGWDNTIQWQCRITDTIAWLELSFGDVPDYFTPITIDSVYAYSASFTCGDANGDGNVNVGDAVYLINYVFKYGSAPNPFRVGDANGDYKVNVGDVVYLINYVFKGGPASNCETVTDIDGNVYQTVTIGTQVWMAENLKVTHYRNGDPIPNVTDKDAWQNLNSGAYCEYNNDGNNVAAYGRLFNWFAVADSRNIAPAGWHVASDAEWKQLEIYLGMSQTEADRTEWRGTDEGGKLKEAGTTHWLSPNYGATDECGFSALPGGYRLPSGSYYVMGEFAQLWSSTEDYNLGPVYRILKYDASQINRGGYDKQCGFSVRCVKD